MPFAKEGKILIKILFNIKDYNAKDLLREFSSKGWNIGLVYKLLQKLQTDGSVGHPPRSGRQRSTITLIMFTCWYHTKVAKQEVNICN